MVIQAVLNKKYAIKCGNFNATGQQIPQYPPLSDILLIQSIPFLSHGIFHTCLTAYAILMVNTYHEEYGRDFYPSYT